MKNRIFFIIALVVSLFWLSGCASSGGSHSERYRFGYGHPYDFVHGRYDGYYHGDPPPHPKECHDDHGHSGAPHGGHPAEGGGPKGSGSAPAKSNPSGGKGGKGSAPRKEVKSSPSSKPKSTNRPGARPDHHSVHGGDGKGR